MQRPHVFRTGRTRRVLLCLVALGILIALTGAFAVRANRLTLVDLLRGANTAQGSPDAVATVNGDAISLQALENVAAVQRMTYGPSMADSDAYTSAMDYLITNLLLVQEAHRRGLRATEQEARDYIAQVRAQAAEAPEIAEVLEEQARVYSEQELLAAYVEALAVGKLHAALADEAPTPSPEQVAAYAARRGDPSTIVLIPIDFTDIAAAQEVLAELDEQAATHDADQFASLVAGYALRLTGAQPHEFVHRTYRFTDPESDLPDYARDALDKAEGALGLFVREDGSATLYLVLKSVQVSDEEAWQAAYRILSEQGRGAHADSVIERLTEEAEVTIHYDNLPEDAREALRDYRPEPVR